MTQLILKNDISSHQLNALLQFFHAWNIEAETLPATTHTKVKEPVAAAETEAPYVAFSESFGMWKDRDIDAKKLRRMALGKRFPK
jgi:hypothetical protein